MKKSFLGNLFYLFCTALFVSCNSTSALQVGELRCESLVNPLGIDNTSPHLSWILTSNEQGEEQHAYQVLVASSEKLLSERKADLWNSGKIVSKQSTGLLYQGKPLTSKDMAYWKVRVWDKEGKATDWSKPACFAIGLLKPEDWKAQYIGIEPTGDEPKSPQFRKTFLWKRSEEKVLLHVNSLGYHEAYLNGEKISNAVLTPAVSQYDKRSLTVTYDVTGLLRDGENDLVVWLGQGWYHDGLPGVVKGGPFFKAQMEEIKEGNSSTMLITDSYWRARESGYQSTWRIHQLGGEIIDASQLLTDMTTESLNQADWGKVRTVNIPEHKVTPQMVEMNQIQEEWHPKTVMASGDTAWIFDMGKNFTGWTKINFPQLQAGQRIRISYCDFLDEKGQFRDGIYEDYYYASGKENETFCNKFNYHAYRYLKISNLKEAPALSDVTACLIHTDYSGKSTFSCSDNDLNAIHDMIHYTLECLMIGGDMVDCPHVERLGYGGDGNASTLTGQTLFNLAPTYMNWMQAWSDCMREDGDMPHTAPNPFAAGGGPYWCGFIITASWQTYVNYGDSRLLERYYPYMQRWLEYVEIHSPNGLLKKWPDQTYRNWYLGDWATPTGIDQTIPSSIDVVNNCYIAICYQTMEKIAQVLGKEADKSHYGQCYRELIKRIQDTFYDLEHKSYSSGTQIDLVYPMLCGATPEDLIPEVEKTLYQVTEERFKGHLSAGLVGIPVITEWATRNHEVDFMYNMLKKRDYPGYLYMIDNGATTTWEHWNGERSHIHNCYNGIGSWFYQALGGIVPDEKQPGYKHFFIRPQIPEKVSWAKVSKDTPYGPLSVRWEKETSSCTLEVNIPVGSNATITFPVKVDSLSINGAESEAKKEILLPSGHYRIIGK